jgi:hypothetical protein
MSSMEEVKEESELASEGGRSKRGFASMSMATREVGESSGRRRDRSAWS